MGILDKIEDKLSGSNKKESSDYTSGDYAHTSTTEPGSRQHPIGSSTDNRSTGITGGTALGSHGTTSNVPGSFPGDNTHGTTTTSHIPDRSRGDNVTSTTTTTSTADRLLGHNSGVTGSNTDHNIPRKPYDPYSSSGQQTAANAVDGRDTYGASNNRGPAGDIGSRRDYDESGVHRTQHGGVSNQLSTGPHAELENRDAVPIAGGQKIGTGAAYDSQSQGVPSQHNNTTSGYGTSGYGTSGRGTDSTHQTGQKTVGPHNSDMLNKLDPRVDSDASKGYGTSTSTSRDQTSGYQGYGSSDPLNTSSTTTGSSGQHHHGRDGALTGGAGALGAGATSGRHNHNEYGRTGDRYGQGSADQPLSQNQDFNSRHNTSGHTGLGTSSTGAGVGGLMSGTSHRDHDHNNNSRYNDSNTSTTGRYNDSNTGTTGRYNDSNSSNTSNTTAPHSSSLLNKLDPRVDNNSATTGSSSNNNNNNNNTTSTSSHSHGNHSSNTSGSGGLTSFLHSNNRHTGYDQARQNHGGGTYGVGYEKGYEAGYRDAMAHAESLRGSSGSGSGSGRY